MPLRCARTLCESSARFAQALHASRHRDCQSVPARFQRPPEAQKAPPPPATCSRRRRSAEATLRGCPGAPGGVADKYVVGGETSRALLALPAQCWTRRRADPPMRASRTRRALAVNLALCTGRPLETSPSISTEFCSAAARPRSISCSRAAPRLRRRLPVSEITSRFAIRTDGWSGRALLVQRTGLDRLSALK